MLIAMRDWLDGVVVWITQAVPAEYMLSDPQYVRGLLALILVSAVCGAVGSLVVSNRMAFFSDALAHSAFAGVALGLLIAMLAGIEQDDFRHWVTAVMVAFGVCVGLLIAYVQETTTLPSDSVIGVFFAGSLGLGAIFVAAARGQRYFSLENFIFGQPLFVGTDDILWLMALSVATIVFLVTLYNPLVFGSFNDSLARSRRVRARLARYLFIVLLGLIVNLCQQTVGILLINGLLIVPGATAANLSRNLRQLFWWALAISLVCAMAGLYLSYEISVRTSVKIGVAGMITVLNVFLFMVSTLLRPVFRGRG